MWGRKKPSHLSPSLGPPPRGKFGGRTCRVKTCQGPEGWGQINPFAPPMWLQHQLPRRHADPRPEALAAGPASPLSSLALDLE